MPCIVFCITESCWWFDYISYLLYLSSLLFFSLLSFPFLSFHLFTLTHLIHSLFPISFLLFPFPIYLFIYSLPLSPIYYSITHSLFPFSPLFPFPYCHFLILPSSYHIHTYPHIYVAIVHPKIENSNLHFQIPIIVSLIFILKHYTYNLYSHHPIHLYSSYS